MAHLTDRDIERIAASLSGEYGTFPVSNLVNYGSTIIVRPGARTSQGVVFAGVEVGAMLPCEYVAVPIAVEYGAESGADLSDLDAELGAEIASLASDVLGAVSVSGRGVDLSHPAVRARYARVTEKFRFRVGQLRSAKGKSVGKSASALARAQRALKRLGKIWKHMGKLGIDRSGLVSPATLAAELAGAKAVRPQLRPSSPIVPLATRYPATRPNTVLMPSAHRYVPHRVAPTVAVTSPAPTAPVAAPVVAPVAASAAKYTPVSKAYLADQAALEREIQSGTPSYFGASDHAVGQEDLSADLRAETIGYLFGAMEHDYFGVAEVLTGGSGGSTGGLDGGSDGGSDIEFTSEDFRALFGRDPGAALVEVFGDADLDALSQSGDVSAMIDVLGGVLESERLAGLADQVGWSQPAHARRFRRLSLQRSNAARLAKVRLESPVVYESVVLEDDDDGLDDGIVHLGDEDEADDADDGDGDGDGDGGGEDESKESKSKSASLDADHAKAANLQRRALLPSIADVRALGEKGEGSVLDRTERAAKLVTQITDVLRSIAPNGSVNYARLRPVGMGAFGSDADPVIVIGIQRRTTTDPVDLLEVLMEEEVAEVPVGYDALDAAEMMTKMTHVSDYVGSASRPAANGSTVSGSSSCACGSRCRCGARRLGSTNFLAVLTMPSTNAEGMNDVEQEVYGPVLYGAANASGNAMGGKVSGVAPDAWPDGQAAPLPPPRRVGAEVYGA